MLRGTRRAVAIAFVIVAVGAGVGRASAQEREETEERGPGEERLPTSAELDRATALFEQSAIAYEECRWDAATALLWEAYSLSHEPLLLYNLGRAYDGAGDRMRALDAYRRYLRTAPEDATADAARVRVLELEASLGERAAIRTDEGHSSDDAPATEPASSRAEATPAEPVVAGAPDAIDVLPWAIAGGGGLVLATGGLLAGLAVERRDAAARAETLVDVAATYHDAEALMIAADVCFVAGGVLAAIGITWGIVELERPDGSERHVVEIALGPGGVAVRGTLE